MQVKFKPMGDGAHPLKQDTFFVNGKDRFDHLAGKLKKMLGNPKQI